MQALEPPESHHLSAAQGWLELGNAQEAEVELARIRAEQANHPDVLELKWRLLVEQKDWERGMIVAGRLRDDYPQRADGWLFFAYALRRSQQGGLRQAREALLPALAGFPNEPVIPYNLCCYACQLGDMDEARGWFVEAIKRGNRKQLKSMALQDKDLEPLWEEIRKL